MTQNLINLIDRFGSGFSYNLMPVFAEMRCGSEADVSVVVPVRGRVEFHQPLADHVRRAFEGSGKTYCLTFVEHSNEQAHRAAAESSGSNYVHIHTDGPFNKCLAFNLGFIWSNASHYLFHDLDCMMQSNFVHSLFENLKLSGNSALQSFSNRRVLYCNEQLTADVISGRVLVDSLHVGRPGVHEPARHQWRAPGGSIFCSREQFISVGGFDPEYFFGYSIEDGFFYNKLEVTCGIASCQNPQIELFHLHHPPLHSSNPHLAEHHGIYELWMSLSEQEKLHLMRIKSNHLKNNMKK